MSASTDVYPPGPASVPPELTRPTSAYRRHAYIAFLGLLLFVAAYFALSGWFAYMAYHLLTKGMAMHRGAFVPIFVGACCGFLAIFMLKAMIFVRRGSLDGEGMHEVKPADQPQLFAFLNRIADEARAPRPYRVYLSTRVNAAVFYDLSLLNFIIPSKKNLELGLGLVNVLTLGELKAVLAHEFGHFAQRTMAVGRWVYIGQQIAGHIVVKRDILDRFLRGISNFDIRVAWVGWILRIIVWSIRSLVDTVFGWVVLAQRALSREMELQADLVAVSLTGSDALVHALHRLEAADDAMDRAYSFASGQKSNGKRVEDVFEVQRIMLTRKRDILDDPRWGVVPPVPDASPEQHRVFERRIAQPPRMWQSHPPSDVREANAKKQYISCALDDRSGWVLFTYPKKVRRTVTEQMYSVLKGDDEDEDDDDSKALEALPDEVVAAIIAERFDRHYFDASYRGAYLGRSIVRNVQNINALFGAPLPDPDLVVSLGRLYPEKLTEELERVRDLEEEKAMLRALKLGIAEAPGGLIRHRGADVHRRQLPGLIDSVSAELVATNKRIDDHERLVRSVYQAIAERVGGEWAAYHRSIVQLMHYADHRQFDIEDAQGALENVISVVLADGRVTESEAQRAVDSGGELFVALEAPYREAKHVDLGEIVAAEMDANQPWHELLGEFGLNPPNQSNFGDWLSIASSYTGVAGLLGTVYSVALNELLRVERELARCMRTGEPMPPAPIAPRVPVQYRAIIDERPRQERLGWWDRFQVADGIFPATLRLVVAGGIVATVFVIGRGV